MRTRSLARTSAVTIATASLVVTAFATGTAAAATGAANSSGAKQNVIVLLRNQHAGTPASRHDVHQRQALVQADQAPVRSQIGRLGGKTTHAYSTINAVAASLPAAAVTSLRADPSVAAVVPDLLWHLPQQTQNPVAGRAVSPPANSALCPSDPATPLLEPEALALTHSASDNPNDQTARSLGYTGAGVKVGFIADGLDVNQPDFIRADGSHVIVDYQDFSGDGTNSSTAGGEAFGDASSIAAQGRNSYDLSQFVNPAHPLPAGCTIRVEGVAPGASMVALKVFSNALLTAPTSTIIQAIDWAVTVDHVDVLNESFGSNPYPDNATDPISLFNRDAVDAGVTVVASSGDAGTGNTMGTAATDPWVIGVGATTAEQIYAQQSSYGFQLSNGRYTSDQLSSLSSAGISQTNRVVDLVAPGDLNWALCSTATLPDGTPQYANCTNDAGRPSNIEVFGGTSESAPLTSGAAALVIQAYREAHGGSSPTPQQVREVLDSSADDLGLPAEMQGAGLLDSYRAVQLAASLDSPVKTGGNLSLDPSQISATTQPGDTVTAHYTVTNDGTGVQRVTAALRDVDTVTGRSTQTVNLSGANPVNTFIDQVGNRRSYVLSKFTVPVGVDRMAATVGWTGPTGTVVRISLLDPQGTFTGYSLPQGTGNFGRVEIRAPAPGTWTAIVWTGANAAGYNGPVNLAQTFYKAGSAGTVSPSSFTLDSGQSQRVTVRTTAPAVGASASSLVLTGRFGTTTTGSLVVQSVQKLKKNKANVIHGTFSTANGRSFSPAEETTYLFDVPKGADAINMTLALAGAPLNEVTAHLSDPTGEPVSTVVNQHPSGTATVTDPGLQIIHANPMPGRWQLTLELVNPAASVPQDYTLTSTLSAARVKAKGVPDSKSTVISKSKGSDQKITIHNDGPAPQTYFIDARANTSSTMPLVAAVSASTDPYTATIGLPLQTESVPGWLTPTETTNITVGSSATAPITFDLMPLDSPTAINAPNNPDIESSTGTSATVSHSASPVASVLWSAFPTLIGPAGPDGQSGESVDMQAVATTRDFFAGYTSSTGDPLIATVQAGAPAATPITIPAGGSAVVTLHLAPTGKVGSKQQGTLFVDTLQAAGAEGLSGYADEAAVIPFAFTVGK